MRPIRLTMQAFSSYGKKEVIDFTEPNQNLFLICGDTGAGKTTIFDAIVFALFGEASSENNKKSGTELQSQFADLSVEPYVELVFTEKNGGVEEEYTVTRVPKHQRPSKKKTDSGITDVVGKVSLILPDGSEFSGKTAETDAKIREIVGLTKSQFMQVAMIAQGEFMELLRAKSDTKKEIFRRLFGTEKFQKIISELDRRVKEQNVEFGKILTRCQSSAARIDVPEDFGQAQDLRGVMKRIAQAKQFSTTDMEQLMKLLEELCDRLKEQENTAQERLQKAEADLIQARKQETEAVTLQKSFEQLEEAKVTLDECKEKEEEIRERQKLVRSIQDAFEVMSVWNVFYSAQKNVDNTKASIEDGKKKLPDLEKNYEQTKNAYDLAQEASGKADNQFSLVNERVTKTLAVFGELEQTERNLAKTEIMLKKAGSDSEATAAALEKFDRQVEVWRGQQKELSGTAEAIARLESRIHSADVISDQIRQVEKLQNDAARAQKTAENARNIYIKAKNAADLKNAEYIAKNSAFLDAQAGILASEKLKEGEPCPVCGSRIHPNPCVLKEEHRELTRDVIDALKKEADRLQKAAEEKSVISGQYATQYEALLLQLQEEQEKLYKNIRENIPEGADAELTDLEDAKELLDSWESALETEKQTLNAKQNQLNLIAQSLEHADDEKEKLKEKADADQKKVQNLEKILTAEKANRDAWKAQLAYEKKEDAEAALRIAKEEKEQKEQDKERKNAFYQNAVSALESLNGKLEAWKNALPGFEEALKSAQSDYQDILEKKDLAESEWKQICEAYSKETAKKLQQGIDAFMKKQTAAESAFKTLSNTVAGKEKPELESLHEKVRIAADEKESASDECSRIRLTQKADREAYKELDNIISARQEKAEAYNRLHNLYRRMAGNVTDGRMDIETYVQRYYLERILYAANTRFLDMSAGQFELRMTEDTEAGKGKNKGLDLMVYSNVTGKTREINTLSGGESFIAALSLALGMADQIQEQSAAINLDMMFVDEGFGSLDDHSREQAIRILKGMADGSKLIGIISHVNELKQEIDDQLIITKDESGSSARWQLS